MELTNNQKKLLYLIDQYSETGSETSGKEEWIKDMALKAIIFELTKRNLFDEPYDIAPMIVTWHGNKRYANVSQEGLQDLAYLLEKNYVIELKLATKYHDSVSAFRITDDGKKILVSIPEDLRKVIDSFIICKNCTRRMDIFVHSNKVELKCPDCSNSIEINMLNWETIQYKSEAYFPKLTSFSREERRL